MGRDAIEVHFHHGRRQRVCLGAPRYRLLYLRVGGIDSVYAGVKSQGVAITRELRHENWPARGFNFNDPSGNDVHIEQPD